MCDLQLDMVSWTIEKDEKVLQRLPNARIGTWMRSTVLECLKKKPDISSSQNWFSLETSQVEVSFSVKIGPGSYWTCWLLPVRWWRWVSIWQPDFWAEDLRWKGGDCGEMGWNYLCRTNFKLWCLGKPTVFSFYSLLASLPNTTSTSQVVKSEIRTWEDRHFGFGDHITLRDDNTSWQS